MCGFLFGPRSIIERRLLGDIMRSIEARGPENSGYFLTSRDIFIHSRLRIVDGSEAADQPLISKDGSLAIVFNGEIYNHQELASRHSLILRTSSDTEVILELYKKLGPRFMSELEGMFAFIILDLNSGETFIARDRLGVKPLFFAKSQDGTIWSSTIDSLLEVTGDAGFDQVAIDEFRQIRSFLDGRTLYRAISEFPAGTYEHNGKRVTYWSIEPDTSPPPEEDELTHLLKESISVRLPHGLPFSAFLSGGIDSAVISALAKPAMTWTVGGSKQNEFAEAEEVSRYLGLPNKSCVVDDVQFLSRAMEILYSTRSLIAVPNQVYLDTLAESLSVKHKVVFSGEGADELFAGYDRIFRYSVEQKNLDYGDLATKFGYSNTPNSEIFEYALKKHDKFDSNYLMISSFMQTQQIKTLLGRLDSATGRWGVEARNPFLDTRLVERLFGQPFVWKNGGAHKSKKPLRKIATGLIGEKNATRVKVGFPAIHNKFQNSVRPGSWDYDSWLDFNLRTLEARGK